MVSIHFKNNVNIFEVFVSYAHPIFVIPCYSIPELDSENKLLCQMHGMTKLDINTSKFSIVNLFNCKLSLCVDPLLFKSIN